MANEEQLAILKQGVEAWNAWRESNEGHVTDLSGADLSDAALVEANLSKTDLCGTNLRGANLCGVNLTKANLNGANVSEVSLADANLSCASLVDADLRDSELCGASLTSARLPYAKFVTTGLRGADFRHAILNRTSFSETDLSEATGLDAVLHAGPSSIGIDTFFVSKGKIPEVFLRGCGVPDIFIQYAASLAGQPFEFYSAFISHSSKDQAFAERLHADLQAKGVRCWFAPEDLKIGDKLSDTIEEAIRVHDKLLLVLSEQSIASAWVRREVGRALKREQDKPSKTVLFPVRIDAAFMDSTEQWADELRRNRHVGDFTKWRDHDAYQRAFNRLMRDLKATPAKP